MARPLRIEFPGAVYHVTSRGNEKRSIFKNDRDRKAFLGFLGETAKRFGWSITAWVLMTNHFHLVLQTPEPNLSRGMHWLNGSYAGWFNHQHKRWGHLFGGRFKAFLVEKETYFTEVLRYVVLNPVRAGLSTSPEKYRWSSFRSTAGLDAAPEWLDVNAALAPFAPDTELAQTYYREFVAAKTVSDESLWDKLINGIYLGTEPWAKKMRKVVETKPRSTDHPWLQRTVGRPRMHDVVAAVAEAARVATSSIRGTHGGCLRRLVAWVGWYEGLVTLRTIAASLRLRSEGHVSGLIRRCDREFATDPTLLGYLDQALAIVRT
jgi:REP element-mobilizing transposase RayT